MKSAIVYHWRHAYPGREIRPGPEEETDELMARFIAEGHREEFAWYLSASGDMNYLVVRGEMDRLQVLTAELRT